MILQTRKKRLDLETGIDATQIMHSSRLVSNLTGLVVQPNKAIVGANAFAHESGIHQDGMLKHQETYEIMRPEAVGVTQSRLVLGKHSGRNAIFTRLREMGFSLTEEEQAKAFERFKALAEKKKEISDADLEVLISDEINQAREIYTLDGLQVACGTMGLPTATVRLMCPDGELRVQACVGTGPVDAVYKAIDTIVQVPGHLLEFAVRAVTEGIDALGEVSVRVEGDQAGSHLDAQKEQEQRRTYGGHCADTDIVVASAKAYLAALNKLLVASGKFE
jgi:2-isopropylmalate synthase